jgi:hypothetical protein
VYAHGLLHPADVGRDHLNCTRKIKKVILFGFILDAAPFCALLSDRQMSSHPVILGTKTLRAQYISIFLSIFAATSN